MSVNMRYGGQNKAANSIAYPLSPALGGTGADSVAGGFTVANTTVSGSSTSAGATYNLEKAATAVAGYTPICICGWGSTGMTYLSIANLYLDGDGNINITGRNLGSSAVTPSFNVRVLYGKNG